MDLRAQIEHDLERLARLGPSGFAIAFHIRFTTASFQFQNYPAAWLEVYSKEGLVMQDPIVAFGFTEDSGHRRWSDFAENDPGGVLRRASDFGLNHGVAIVISEDGSRTMAGLSRSDREFTDDEITEAENILKALHHRTLEAGEMSAEARAELRRISVAQTHPKAG